MVQNNIIKSITEIKRCKDNKYFLKKYAVNTLYACFNTFI